MGIDAISAKNSNSIKSIREIKQPEASKKVKAGVMATTVMGVTAGTALSLKRGGYSINPIKIAKDFKNSGLMKMEYDWKNIMRIASGSVAGGLAGGLIFDKKENMKAKIREATIQMFANIMIPLGCVAGGTKLFDKTLKNPLLKLLKQVGADGKPLSNGMVAKWMNVGVTTATLLGAIVGGNKATNLVNEKIYNIKDDRKVKIADMSGHIDDTCLAISTGFGPNNVVTKAVSRVIPLALMVCGYSTGVTQEWPDDVKESRKADPTKPFRL
ncbi:hypothetical protein IJ732_03420 [bacterium]|nr:hypothetical protein [bacterium]